MGKIVSARYQGDGGEREEVGEREGEGEGGRSDQNIAGT
jgi:hypothetical protein